MNIESGLGMLLRLRAKMRADTILAVRIFGLSHYSTIDGIDEIINNMLMLERENREKDRVISLKDEAINEYMELVGDLEELDDDARDKIRTIVKEAHSNAD